MQWYRDEDSGRVWLRCVHCRKELTDERSQAIGLGPICVDRVDAEQLADLRRTAEDGQRLEDEEANLSVQERRAIYGQGRFSPEVSARMDAVAERLRTAERPQRLEDEDKSRTRRVSSRIEYPKAPPIQESAEEFEARKAVADNARARLRTLREHRQ